MPHVQCPLQCQLHALCHSWSRPRDHTNASLPTPIWQLDLGGVGYIRLTNRDAQPDIPSFFAEDEHHSQWSLLLQAATRTAPHSRRSL